MIKTTTNLTLKTSITTNNKTLDLNPFENTSLKGKISVFWMTQGRCAQSKATHGHTGNFRMIKLAKTQVIGILSRQSLAIVIQEVEIEDEEENEANLREVGCLLMVQGKLIRKAIIKISKSFKEKISQASSRNHKRDKKRKQQSKRKTTNFNQRSFKNLKSRSNSNNLKL